MSENKTPPEVKMRKTIWSTVGLIVLSLGIAQICQAGNLPKDVQWMVDHHPRVMKAQERVGALLQKIEKEKKALAASSARAEFWKNWLAGNDAEKMELLETCKNKIAQATQRIEQAQMNLDGARQQLKIARSRRVRAVEQVVYGLGLTPTTRVARLAALTPLESEEN